MADIADDERPVPLTQDRLMQLEHLNQQHVDRIWSLERQGSIARVQSARVRWSSIVGVLLVAAFVNLGVPWYAVGDRVGSGFGLLDGDGAPRWLLLYLGAGLVAIGLVIALATRSGRASPASWYVLTVSGVVMTIAAFGAHGDLPFRAEPRAGVRVAIALSLAIAAISAIAGFLVSTAQRAEDDRRRPTRAPA